MSKLHVYSSYGYTQLWVHGHMGTWVHECRVIMWYKDAYCSYGESVHGYTGTVHSHMRYTVANALGMRMLVRYVSGMHTHIGYIYVHCCYGQWRVQEFVRDMAENMNFFCFSIFQAGSLRKIAEKMIFPTKK